MTKDEALKLALEALEQLDGIDTETECVTIDVGDVITAIKEALAPTSTPCEVQPEQEPGLICHKHDEPKRGCAWCDKHPPKRPWVGLTDEFCITNMFDMGHYSLQIVFKSRKNADEFKAALKEKNT